MAIHVDRELLIEDLPKECIEDCGGPGQKDEPVAYWREKLGFTVDREKAINCLAEYGWDDEIYSWDNERIAETILWMACCSFSELDGTEESSCGSDSFVLD